MNKLNNRIKTYSNISTRLSLLSDRDLAEQLAKAEHIEHFGITGKSYLLNIDNTNIFVKKIPLTDLERQSENVMSTENLFAMPFSSHIGVGGAGISAWRELSVHTMTTNWVISGECQNFPLMYHWRVLPTTKPKPMNEKEREELERKVQYWDNSANERNRLEAIHDASAHIYVFMEYIPRTLFKWLGLKLSKGGDEAAKAITFVDHKLKETNEFMNSRGLLHFDAHFWNILVDDETIYVTDFGLSLWSGFNLSKDELASIAQYQSYDQCVSVTNFLLCIIGCLFNKDPWEIKIGDYLGDKLEWLNPEVVAVIRRYAPIALLITDFFEKMQKISKSTPYPAGKLNKLLDEAGGLQQNKALEICSASEAENEYIRDRIVEYNGTKVRFTQSEEIIFQNYVVKDAGVIVAGITSMIYFWGMLYIDVLFVDEKYRGKNLGSDLLHKVESEAKYNGATLAHLDTFDFQAKDFYLKNGYTIFGELENCPPGHNRYYLCKRL